MTRRSGPELFWIRVRPVSFDEHTLAMPENRSPSAAARFAELGNAGRERTGTVPESFLRRGHHHWPTPRSGSRPQEWARLFTPPAGRLAVRVAGEDTPVQARRGALRPPPA